jgi:hypothetical protein
MPWGEAEELLAAYDASRAAVPSAPADQTALRDRIADTLAATDGWRWVSDSDKARSSTYRGYQTRADAVLAVLPETARLHDQILTLQAELASVRDLLRTENERANSAIDRETTGEEAEEEQRLALSQALGLGTGAPWDAIRERAAELPAPDSQTAEMERLRKEHATWRKLGQRNLERAHEENARLRAVLERIRVAVRRLAAHAVGFGDVLDESDRGPWGKTIAADIAELRRMADEAQQPETRARRDVGRETVEYFLQAQQDDGTWEDASSFMDALDWAAERLAVKRVKYPDFSWRMAERTTTVTVRPLPDCLTCRHWRCNGDGPCGALLDAWQRCACTGPAAVSQPGKEA